jgi:transketolase
LRAIPNLSVIRPADANEAREAWIAAVERKDGPTALVLSRQNLPTLDRNTYAGAENLHRGAYILADLGNGQPQVILMASGSEVQLIIDAGKQLEGEGIPVRLVSFPSWDIFENQPISYQQKVLDPSIEKRISVEAGIKMGWEKWIGEKGRAISLERYGASAPGEILYKEFGLTVDTIIRAVKELLHSD